MNYMVERAAQALIAHFATISVGVKPVSVDGLEIDLAAIGAAAVREPPEEMLAGARALARVVIAAMREPTEEMVQAATGGVSPTSWRFHEVLGTYTAMIDAALKD